MFFMETPVEDKSVSVEDVCVCVRWGRGMKERKREEKKEAVERYKKIMRKAGSPSFFLFPARSSPLFVFLPLCFVRQTRAKSYLLSIPSLFGAFVWICSLAFFLWFPASKSRACV